MNEKEKKTLKPNEFPAILGIIVILLAFVCWMNLGPLLSFGILSIKIFQGGKWTGVGDYLIVHAPYVMMFLALFFGSNLVLKTKLRELIAGTRKYNWKYSVFVGLIYIVFLVIISLLQIKSIKPNPVSFREKLRFFLPVLILTPLQALSEELFFRALPARLIYHNKLPNDLKSSIAIVAVSGVLFLIPHTGNPEFSANSISSGLYYFLWGALAMALGLYANGFEAPVAMHISNNLFIALFVNYSKSSMPTEAFFMNTEPSSSILAVIEAIAVFSIIFLFSYHIKKKRPNLLEGNTNGQS